MGHTDHRALLDGRLPPEHVLDVDGVDVQSPGDDHVLLPAPYGDPAVVVDLSQVTRAQVDAAFRARPDEGFGGGLLVVVLAQHEVRPTDELAGLSTTELSPLVVDDPELAADHRPPDRRSEEH